MEKKTGHNLIDRADRILFGERLGELDSLIENPENRFAHVFLALLHRKGCTVYPIDEARLGDKESQMEYLQTVEKVRLQEEHLADGWYRSDIGTFMGFFGEEEKPVILFYGHDGYRMFDPVENITEKVNAETASRISEKALFVIPAPDERIRSGWTLLLRGLSRQKQDLIAFALVMLFASLITTMVPLVVGYITSVLIPQEQEKTIVTISLSLLMGILAALCLHVVVNRTKLRIQTNAGDRFFTALFSKILDMSPGDESVLTDQLTSLMLPLLSAVNTVISSGAGVLIYLVQCLLVLNSAGASDPEIRNVFYILILAEFVLILILEALSYRKTEKQRGFQEVLTGMRSEMIDNIGTVKSYGIQDRTYYRFGISYDAYLRQKLGNADISLWISAIGTLASSLGVLAIFLIASRHFYDNVGQISSLVSSFSLVAGYIMSLAMSAGEVSNSLPYMRLADTILAMPAETAGTEGVAADLKGSIELQDVSFSYREEANPVIRGVSLKINPGEYVGIAGSSGCGKSTLIRLMLGFLKPTSGSIYYDDRDIGQYDLRQLRRQFGVVLQDAAVVTGNIRMNIGMSEDADMEKVTEAAKKAAVYDEIDAMPMKFNTILSSEADVVSGGQKQRIVLARALMNNPKILFLDEATSAMDNVTQQVVKENLDALGITRIVVAHRLSTVKDCDRILVMEKGRIAEEGSFEELMKMDGLFAKMARRNLL